MGPICIDSCNCLAFVGDYCPPGEHVCAWVDAQNRLPSMTAAEAILTAGLEHPNSAFLGLISKFAFDDPAYRKAGVSSMLLRHILCGRRATRTETRPHWDCAVLGISNVLHSILCQCQAPKTCLEDKTILQELRASYSAILDVIWRDLRFLKPEGNLGDARRILVSSLLRNYLLDPGMARQMASDPTTAKLVFHCWMLTNPPDVFRPGQSTADTVRSYLICKDETGMCMARVAQTTASKVLKVPTLMSYINYRLKNKKLVGQSLVRELDLLYCIVWEPSARSFIEEGVFKQVAIAMRRQLEMKDEHIEPVLFYGFGIFMRIMLHIDRDPTQSIGYITTLIETTCLMEVASAGIRLNAVHQRCTPNPTFAGDWGKLFSRLQHAITCDRVGECNFIATSELVSALRASLARVAVPTWVALEELESWGSSPECGAVAALECKEKEEEKDKGLAFWCEFLGQLKITEDDVREQYRLDKKCGNIICPARLSWVKSPKKATCVGCRSVFYCDRACQKRDWVHHKTVCKKLAGKRLLVGSSPVSLDETS
ncbi:unnamed protein product [Cyclocybe aegerita]|uniref:MYND-type domain-containing protein n=1 Tax=Cyclocybe aegerita TaxID=1973307 RepID=A0A8S0X1T2_CYCAE|nr:unnamed protein product [Cyclocybe aegerita]